MMNIMPQKSRRPDMNALSRLTPRSRSAVLATLMVAASVALTSGFACALPLAAFATMSAMLFRRGVAVVFDPVRSLTDWTG